jgi:hypothetical protein
MATHHFIIGGEYIITDLHGLTPLDFYRRMRDSQGPAGRDIFDEYPRDITLPNPAGIIRDFIYSEFYRDYRVDNQNVNSINGMYPNPLHKLKNMPVMNDYLCDIHEHYASLIEYDGRITPQDKAVLSQYLNYKLPGHDHPPILSRDLTANTVYTLL